MSPMQARLPNLIGTRRRLAGRALRLPFLVLVATFSIVPLGTALLYGSAQLVIYEVPVFWMAWAAGSLWLMFDGGRFLNGLSAETARLWAPGLILLGLLNLGISVSILLFSAAGGRG